ncbi:hypothetical protein LXJ58_32605, partial [Escherichia coli]|nr:hypothetical protein [Escherichia coli]
GAHYSQNRLLFNTYFNINALWHNFIPLSLKLLGIFRETSSFGPKMPVSLHSTGRRSALEYRFPGA